MGDADHRGHRHARMGHCKVLQIDGADPFATAFDHILAAVSDLKITVGVNCGDITGWEPTFALGVVSQWIAARRFKIGFNHPRPPGLEVALRCAIPG